VFLLFGSTGLWFLQNPDAIDNQHFERKLHFIPFVAIGVVNWLSKFCEKFPLVTSSTKRTKIGAFLNQFQKSRIAISCERLRLIILQKYEAAVFNLRIFQLIYRSVFFNAPLKLKKKWWINLSFALIIAVSGNWKLWLSLVVSVFKSSAKFEWRENLRSHPPHSTISWKASKICWKEVPSRSQEHGRERLVCQTRQRGFSSPLGNAENDLQLNPRRPRILHLPLLLLLRVCNLISPGPHLTAKVAAWWTRRRHPASKQKFHESLLCPEPRDGPTDAFLLLPLQWKVTRHFGIQRAVKNGIKSCSPLMARFDESGGAQRALAGWTMRTPIHTYLGEYKRVEKRWAWRPTTPQA
jgi:hypothetical protein